MTLPAALLAIGWMIRDTLRQSLASRLFWVMLGVSAVVIVFCLGVRTTDRPRLPTAPGETPSTSNETMPADRSSERGV